MTSLSSLESLASHQSFREEKPAAAAAAQADEAPLALFIGAGHLAYLFTTRRFLILKRAKPLTRAAAGCKMIDFKRTAVDFGLEEMLGWTAIKAEFPIAEVAYIDAERVYSAGAVLVYARGRKFTLTLGHKQAEIAAYVDALRSWLEIPKSAASSVMKRELKSWTVFTILTGSTSLLASLVFPGMLDPLWGLTLVIVGAGILCSAEPAMFIILGVGMAWAALMNVLGLTSSPLRNGHLPIGPLFQIYWATVLFTKYRKYEHLYDESGGAGDDLRAGSRWQIGNLARSFAAALPRLRRSSAKVAEYTAMPLLSLAIAGVEVLLLLSLFEASLLRWPGKVLTLLSHGQMHLAMVGAAVGCASLCSRRGKRRAAVAGVMINVLMAATLISLLITGLLHR